MKKLILIAALALSFNALAEEPAFYILGECLTIPEITAKQDIFLEKYKEMFIGRSYGYSVPGSNYPQSADIDTVSFDEFIPGDSTALVLTASLTNTYKVVTLFQPSCQKKTFNKQSCR